MPTAFDGLKLSELVHGHLGSSDKGSAGFGIVLDCRVWRS